MWVLGGVGGASSSSTGVSSIQIKALENTNKRLQENNDLLKKNLDKEIEKVKRLEDSKHLLKIQEEVYKNFFY